MRDKLVVRKMQKIDAEIKGGKRKVLSEADVKAKYGFSNKKGKSGFGIAKGAKPFKRELLERNFEGVDAELLSKIVRGLDDIKAGKIKKWK